jgi:hypothetical protein
VGASLQSARALDSLPGPASRAKAWQAQPVESRGEFHPMSAAQLLEFYLLWTLIGCTSFSIFVIVVFRTGLAWVARNRTGELKKDIPLRGYLTMLVIPLSIIGLLLVSNYVSLQRNGIELGFLSLWLLNLGYYLILLLYDMLVIDYFVLLVWRLKFLDIPEELERGSMKQHFIMSLPVGVGAGAVITLIGTLISYFVLFGR